MHASLHFCLNRFQISVFLNAGLRVYMCWWVYMYSVSFLSSSLNQLKVVAISAIAIHGSAPCVLRLSFQVRWALLDPNYSMSEADIVYHGLYSKRCRICRHGAAWRWARGLLWAGARGSRRWTLPSNEQPLSSSVLPMLTTLSSTKIQAACCSYCWTWHERRSWS